MMKTRWLDVRKTLLILILTSMVLLRVENGAAAETVRLVPVSHHHVVGINSGQPYVAGFHVLTDDFRTYRMIDGAEATVSFPSTNASSFPVGSWIGTGLFLQAQDHRYLFIDYGFYVTVALDSSGNLFVDVGLHQTREGSLPIQQPGSQLVYAFSWQLFGIEPSSPVTLIAQWNVEGLLEYSIRTGDTSLPLMSINVSELPDCENIMPQFYTGNVIGQQFPLGQYVDFFQFGVTGSGIISNDQWKVLIEDPRFLKDGTWINVEKAWSVQGDISYLDQDARWGGAPYTGVEAQPLATSQQNADAVVFSYASRTLKRGTVLWDKTRTDSKAASGQSYVDLSRDLSVQMTMLFLLSAAVALRLLVVAVNNDRRRALK